MKEGEILEKGFIRLPERAGIGVEMDEDGARKAQVPNTPWFEPATEVDEGPHAFHVCRALARVVLAAALLAVCETPQRNRDSHARAAHPVHARLDR